MGGMKPNAAFQHLSLCKSLFVECLYLFSNLPSDLQTYLLSQLSNGQTNLLTNRLTNIDHEAGVLRLVNCNAALDTSFHEEAWGDDVSFLC